MSDASDASSLQALRLAVGRSPDDAGLRLLLAERLLGAGEAEEAMAHALVVLDMGVAVERATAILDAARAGPTEPTRGDAEGDVAPADDVGGAPVGPGPARDIDLELWDLELERASEHPRFDDVAGLDDVVDAIRTAFLGPLRSPDLQRTYGIAAGGGILLYGPPGCGKTLLARALAGETDARFCSLSMADLVADEHMAPTQALSAAFARARAVAPTVLFIDELDALGRARTDVSGGLREVVTQLLQELDGIDVHTEPVLVLGATNQPWAIDPALRRPGRFDSTLLVLPPDRPARAAILERHLRGRLTERIDLDDLARRTDGYSGADLRMLCETAARRVAARASATSTPPITGRDLRAALAEVAPSIGPWLEVARNFVTFSNDSGQYDDLRDHLSLSSRRRRRR